MADNITLSTNIGSGSVLATDDIGGTHYQIVKLTYGALDSQTIAASGAGAVSAGVPRFTLASDDPAVALLGTIDTDTGVIAGDTTSIDGKITACNTGAVVLAAGTAEIGKLAAGVAEIGNVKNSGTFAVQAAQSGTWNVTNVSGTVSLPTGAATAANQSTANSSLSTIAGDTTSLDGKVTACNTGAVVISSGTVDLGATDNAVLDSIVTNTAKGVSHYRNIDANAEAEIKGSAGTLHWIHCINLTAALAYVHLYDNVAASVTPGTTTPDFTFPLPTQGDTNGAGFNLRIEQAFANGITMVVTTTTDGSTGDPGTNGVFVNAGFS